MICLICKKLKDELDFYKSNKTQCKNCVIENVLKKRDKEKVRLYQSNYYKNWYIKNGRKNRLSSYASAKKWDLANYEKIKVHRIVRKAILTGNLLKPDLCEKCGRNTRLVAHHEDYTQRLRVNWLCGSCHKIKHLKIRLK